MKHRLTTGHVGTAPLDCPIAQSSTGLIASITQTMALLMSALREIFDESAYAHFLNRKQVVSSREAYAAFCRECELTKARRPRCC